MSIEGCPHGPGNPAECRECTLEGENAAKALAILETRIESAKAELAEEELGAKRADPTRWGHSEHPSELTEHWQGAHLTREAAIKEGRVFYGGCGFWIARGVKCDPGQFAPTADEIIDLMSDCASDQAGDPAEDWPDGVGVAAEDELNELLAAWARKHMTCEFWIEDGHVEEIPHVADDLGAK